MGYTAERLRPSGGPVRSRYCWTCMPFDFMCLKQDIIQGIDMKAQQVIPSPAEITMLS